MNPRLRRRVCSIGASLSFGVAFVAALLIVTQALILPAVVRAASDATVPINVSKTCASDGACVPEFTIEREDTGQSASVAVLYTPSWDPLVWNITVRNVHRLTVDASLNYETRGCAVFFSDCPDTTASWWLARPDRFAVNLDSDTVITFTVVNVPRPAAITMDGLPWNGVTYAATGGTVWNAPAGIHAWVFHMRSVGGPGDPLLPGCSDRHPSACVGPSPWLLLLVGAAVVLVLFLAIDPYVFGDRRRRREG